MLKLIRLSKTIKNMSNNPRHNITHFKSIIVIFMTYSKYWFGAEENHMVKEGVAGAEGSWGACSLLPL